jgi:putative Holliday junction resolvase
LAVSDAAGTLAFPAGHLVRSKLGPDVERVLAIARDREVQGFVVGIPFSLDGGTGPGARRARGFARSLQKHTELPIYTVDERFTSVEAEGLLREAGRQPSREKGSVDAAAAVLILERFLDLQRE